MFEFFSTITAVQDALGNVTVESDLLSCRIENGSRDLISALLRKQTAQQPVSAKLVGYLERAKDVRGLETHELLKFSGITSKVTLEEAGPLRVVVKIEGDHEIEMNRAKIFPFTVRLYFYAGSDEVKIVHTFIFNAN